MNDCADCRQRPRLPGVGLSRPVAAARTLLRMDTVSTALCLVFLTGCASVPATKPATKPVYGSLTYGFDRANWNVICKEFPVVNGEVIHEEVAARLRQEGWLEPNRPPPAASDVNETCRRLGYKCPTCP